jgi:sugar/nucleoside kinase (ribokinase family)
MYGDIGGEIIEHISRMGKAAVDVQCLLRCVENESMVFRDWKEKKKYLPMVNYLKTDAAEAEVITGKKEMTEAVKCLYSWGAKEIMITHNTEVMVYDGRKIYTQPLKPKNLTGRTGRGDTCFSAYITERIHHGIEESLQFAAALVSLKMEKPGPFKGTRDDVMDFIKMYYI